jgi:putative DNA primase/helicase
MSDIPLETIRAHDAQRVNDATSRATTDSGNADFFVENFQDLLRYDHARKRWLIWDSHRWRPDNDAAVDRMALETLRQLRNSFAIQQGREGLTEEQRKECARRVKWLLNCEGRNRLAALADLARKRLPIADNGENWDSQTGLLGVPNGVLDLRTGELRDGEPEDRITLQAGVPFDRAAECSRWLRFLDEVFDDPATVKFVQRLAGYSLTGEASADLLVFLMGVGSNGKSTFIEALLDVAGDYGRVVGAVAIQESNRSSHTTEVADLQGSRLAVCEELGDTRLNNNRLKYISGGGRVTARKMRQDNVTFPQTWQLWFTTNGLPQSDDNTWGFWRRVVAIDFPHIFPRDDVLGDQLRAEYPGILRWAVEGAVAYYRDRSVGEPPPSVQDKTKAYRLDLDPLESAFEAGYLVEDEDSAERLETLYGAYLRWFEEIKAQAPGILPLGKLAFSAQLKQRHTYKQVGPKGQRENKFVGVKTGR